MTVEELEHRIVALEAEVARLKATPVMYHYYAPAYCPQPPFVYPNWPQFGYNWPQYPYGAIGAGMQGGGVGGQA